MKKINLRIAELRRKVKITQQELGDVVGVSFQTISKWEKDVAHPDITLLPRLSEVLGVTEHELITASIDINLFIITTIYYIKFISFKQQKTETR